LSRAVSQIFLSPFQSVMPVWWNPARWLLAPVAVRQTLATTKSLLKNLQCQVNRKMASATAAAGVLIWPKPPPIAVNVVLLRRLHIDSGGVSALLLLGFGFGESKAKGFVSPETSQSWL
jgi:hypothetical protein